MMQPYLVSAANLGANAAEAPIIAIGMGFDTALTNQAAVDAARAHAYGLVRGINDTTKEILQREVGAFLQQPTRIRDLADTLQPTFGKRRAKLIAQTETTRAYAQAHEETWKDINRQVGQQVIIGQQWVTANDEAVCPACSRLGGLQYGTLAIPQDEATQEANGVIARFGESFVHPGGEGAAARFKGTTYQRPPAHPGCRCGLAPVIEEIPA